MTNSDEAASSTPEAHGAQTDDTADEVKPHWGRVAAWALWDWATQPFNSVIITFVFVALYLVSDSFLPADVAAQGEGAAAYDEGIAALSRTWGWVGTGAGILVAVLAPVLGQRADRSGRRKRWLAVSTAVMVLCMLGLFFVEADPRFFLLGAALLAIGLVFQEIGGVQYNALIAQVSTPRNVGRVSGLGWGLGYIGGIVALLLVVVLAPTLPADNGMAYRLIGVGAAVWTMLFGWAVFAFVPENPATARDQIGFLESYRVLWRDLSDMWRRSRATVWFLVASAVYRDGLAGIFVYGAIIAAVSFKFTDDEVIMFGIGANLIAGIATIVFGRFDDRFGPRKVIIWSLVGLLVCGSVVVAFAGSGKIIFWTAGLALTAFVGPVQSASRSYLARVAPRGKEGEAFGLYATTGRAASFLAPMMWAITIGITGATLWGTAGVLLVVLAGLILMRWVKEPSARAHMGEQGDA